MPSGVADVQPAGLAWVSVAVVGDLQAALVAGLRKLPVMWHLLCCYYQDPELAIMTWASPMVARQMAAFGLPVKSSQPRLHVL